METQYKLQLRQMEYGEVVALKPDPASFEPEAVTERAAEGWQKNTGKAPAKDGCSVDVIYRNGESSSRCRIGKAFDGAADWTLTNDPRDIVEYRLLGNGIFA